MRIAIIAPGSQGDVQPFLALGKGLMEAGHKVRLITNKNYESQVNQCGLDFWPIEVNMEDIIRSDKMREVLEGGSLLKSMFQMGKDLKAHAEVFTRRSLSGSHDMDLIIAGISGLFTGYSIAEKLNIQFLQAFNVPFSPTRSFSGVLFPNTPAWFGGFFHSISHKLTQQMIWQAYRPTDKVVRQEVLGLTKSPIFGPFKLDGLRHGKIIYGISPSVISRPDDWSKNIHMTGFWTLKTPSNWKPPSELTDFLQDGPPPLYIGFGSMSSKNPEETAQLVLKALKETNQRAIVFSGWGGISKSDLADSILMIDSVPHSWLFQQVKAVIHHGGAGTTAAGLSSGIPSVILPFHGDQPYWGKLIEKLGVGPKPIPRNKLTTEKFVHAIKTVISNRTIQERAATLGSKIRAEDGIKHAVEIISDLNL